MASEPPPPLARARHGDRIVAESTRAVRVDEPGMPPTLCFPAADTVGDVGELVVSSEDDTPPFLDGHVRFDPDRVQIELVEGEGGDPRDVAVTAFPNWGDASHLADLLDVRSVAPGAYRSVARSDWRRPVVEGSQMLGQAMVAAQREAPGRRPVWAAMTFSRVADAAEPLDISLDPVADGRTFTTYATRVCQAGKVCAAGTVLLDRTAPDAVRHAADPPAVPGPLDCPRFDMSVTGRDVRFVDDAYTGDPEAPVGPPVLDAWVRFRRLPDDPALHVGLLAQFTGHIPIAAALRPHAGIGQDQAHRTLSTAINAITISIHDEIHADRWMLYHHHSTFAGDGMTHAECRVHDEGGALLASFTVDAMVRPFADPTATQDDRTAL
jgi:acyl-CoA thioesterase